MFSFRSLIATSLNVSQRSRDGVRLNGSAREYSVKRFEQSHGATTTPDANIPVLIGAEQWTLSNSDSTLVQN